MIDNTTVVYVIDDDPSIRKALSRLLKSIGMQTVTFATAEEFLNHTLPDLLSCIIADVRMPGLSGLELQRILAERKSRIPIVFITGHGDIPMAVRAMKAGAISFLGKPFNDEKLLDAVQQAIESHAQTRQTSANIAEIQQRADLLSPREREVMNLVVTGMLNKNSGQKLGVTEKTIKVHRARVMRKMQAHSLVELVHLAEKIGVDAPLPSH
jgi:FixJ family two-component response regulator